MFKGSCVWGAHFEGYMGTKPIESGIWALSINDQNIFFFYALNTISKSYFKIVLLFSLPKQYIVHKKKNSLVIKGQNPYSCFFGFDLHITFK